MNDERGSKVSMIQSSYTKGWSHISYIFLIFVSLLFIYIIYFFLIRYKFEKKPPCQMFVSLALLCFPPTKHHFTTDSIYQFSHLWSQISIFSFLSDFVFLILLDSIALFLYSKHNLGTDFLSILKFLSVLFFVFFVSRTRPHASFSCSLICN